MSKPRVAVLHGPESSASLRDLLQGSAQRHELVFVMDPADMSAPLRDLAASVAEVVVAEQAAWPEVVGESGARGATTFTDRYVDALDAVCERLDLPGRPLRQGVWDKLVQRRLLNESGASAVPAHPVDSLASLAAARREIGTKAILKPRRGSTSRGVVVVGPEESDADVWARFEEAGAAPSARLLLEKYLDGVSTPPGLEPFVSVDTLSVGPERHHLGVNDKLTLVRSCLESGVVGPTRLDADERREVLRIVDLALDSLGIEDRMTHTEVRLTHGGPQVVEVNGRLGGYVQGLTKLITGIDACRAALDVAAGLGDDTVARLREGRATVGSSCAGVLMLPLDSTAPDLVNLALKLLREDPSVRAVERAAPVSASFGTVVAWFTGASHGAVRSAMTETVRALVARAPVVAAAIDHDWLTEIVA